MWTEENSCGIAEPVVFIEVFVKVVTDRNQVKLQPDGIQTSSDGSFVASVIFENAKCALGLDRSVHSEQGTVDIVEIV